MVLPPSVAEHLKRLCLSEGGKELLGTCETYGAHAYVRAFTLLLQNQKEEPLKRLVDVIYARNYFSEALRVAIEGKVLGDVNTFAKKYCDQEKKKLALYAALKELGSALAEQLAGVSDLHEKQQEAKAMAGPSLAGIMEENGFSCTSTSAVFQKILNLVSKLDERAVAQVIGLVAGCGGSTKKEIPLSSSEGLGLLLGISQLKLDDNSNSSASKGGASWNMDVVLEGLKEAGSFSGFSWSKVAHCFDYAGFFVPNEECFGSLLKACRTLSQGEAFPMDAVCGKRWANARGQLSFLAHLLNVPGKTLEKLVSMKNVPIDRSPLSLGEGGGGDADAHAAEGLVKNVSDRKGGSCWLSTVVCDTLFDLGDVYLLHENKRLLGKILEGPKQECPHDLLLTSVSCKNSWRDANLEVVSDLIQPYINGHPSSMKVLEQVWLAKPSAIVRALVEEYTRDPTSITRALDVCQDLKILMEILKSSSYAFMLDLASLAARREYLNLEKWLAEMMQERGQFFVAASLDFMDEKFKPTDSGTPKAHQIFLSPESAQVFLQFLLRFQENFGEGEQSQLKRIVAQMSSLQNVHGTRNAFAPGVEDEANANFQNIYNGQQSIGDAIVMLTKLKNSPNERDNEVFACMIHNLFDEYRFFPKYPDKELCITAQLFGELVQNQLVSSVTLSIALRYILDALSKPPAYKMFTFGKNALEQFMTRLHEWPKFCSHLLMIPNIRQSFPALVQYLESSSTSQQRQQLGRAGEAADATGGQGEINSMTDSYASSNILNMLQGNQANSSAAGAYDSHAASMKQANPTSAATAAAAAAAAAVRTGSSQGGQPANPLVPGESEMVYQQGSAPRSPSFSPSMSPGLNPQIASMNPSLLKLDNALQSMPNVHFTLNAETLESADLNKTFPVPSDAIADKIHFMVNNLSSMTLDQKCKEIKNLLTSEYHSWFANYMIVKRVAQEPNFHQLYLSLLDTLNAPDLNQSMIQTTVQYVKILIKSERIKSQSSDRSLLKNLGSWLGQMTIARDKPVLQKDLDLKKVILEAYEKGKMIAVIPFVHKILEPCKNTKVFGPPNPWVMAICSLCNEIYKLSKLKLNLKFEFEMMFKDLGLHASDVKPSNIVAGRAREMYGNPDFTVDKSAPPMPSDAQKPASQAAGQRGADGGDAQRSAAGGLPIQSGEISIQGDWLNFVKVTTPTFIAIPGVKRFFANAMDASVREVIAPVVERSVTISCMTVRELVPKDFAFEPDENRVRQAARWMVAALASSLALVTCKEPLRATLTSHIWQMLQRIGIREDALEQSVNTEVAENLDFCCTVIEMHAIEKAMGSIDEAIQNSCMLRRKHAESRSTAPFVDTTVLQGQLPNLPEALHHSLAGSRNQYRVYEEFVKIQRLITNPNEASAPATAMLAESQKQARPTAVSSHNAAAISNDISGQAENLRALLAQVDKLSIKEGSADSYAQLQYDSELKKLVQTIFEIIDTKVPISNVAASEQCAKQIFLSMLQGVANKLRVGVYLALLEKLNSLVAGLDLKLTEWFGTVSEEVWLQRVDLAETMVRRGLLNLRELDRTLSTMIAARRGGPSTDFAIHVVRQCIVLEPLAQSGDMALTLEVLAKVAAQGRGGGAGDALAQLVEQAKRSSPMPKSSSPGEEAKTSQVSDGAPGGAPGGVQQQQAAVGSTSPVSKDTVSQLATAGGKESNSLHEQVSYILDEWSKISDLPNRDKMAAALLVTLQQSGFLKSDETAEQFFTSLVEIAVSHCLNSAESQEGNQPASLSLDAVDAFVKLVAFLIDRSANESDAVNPAARGVRRAAQLFRVLGVVVNTMQKTSKENPNAFNPRPFFRMFIGLYMEILESNAADEVIMIPSLAAIADALLALQPLRIPAFAFSWLELVSHRSFMPKLLLATGQNGWPHFQKLLIALLQFLEPYLRNAELTDSIRLMYKGTLRMLLVLLHDFPEFLCKYHFQLCDVIPSSCIQMRNLMLSAFPRNMRLPDPFTPNLKVDLLPEISESPRIVVDFNSSLLGLQVPLNTYLSMRQPANFLSELPQKLLLPQAEALGAGTRYNVPLINALVLYIGMNAIHKGQAIPMEMFRELVMDLDAEGRYLLLNAIANQLRYPNSHTHYFSCVLLFLFAESSVEIVKEQITRVLLERLIVNRPHPWGLLITFIELIKNPRYQFWSHGFTHCAPEVERLFENVARSCIGQQKQEDTEKKTAIAP
jgi:CCR4-NOT transcription complex subunit 1